MFRIVTHTDNGGMFIRINRQDEKKERVKEFFCEKCQKEFKNRQALFMHNLKTHKPQ